MYVQAGDVRLFYDVEGPALVPDGPVLRERSTVICLHGGPGLDHSMFRPAFSPLSDVAQVVYLDQRGHGRSDRSEPSRWSLGQWADDLHAFCQALGIAHPVVLGTSFGGYVAMTYAVKYSEHPAKLVLVSTAARGTGNAERQGRVYAAFERLGGAGALEVVRRAFENRTPEAFQEYLRVCGPLYNCRPPDPDAAKRTLANHAVLQMFESPGAEGVTFEISHRLGEVRCPVLVVGGEDDPITPIAEQRHIADALPCDLVRFASFPSCGHGVARDDAERLLRVVAEFVVS